MRARLLVLVFTVPWHFIMVALGLVIIWPVKPFDWIKNWRAKFSSIFHGMPNGQTFQLNSYWLIMIYGPIVRFRCKNSQTLCEKFSSKRQNKKNAVCQVWQKFYTVTGTTSKSGDKNVLSSQAAVEPRAFHVIYDRLYEAGVYRSELKVTLQCLLWNGF